MESISYWLATIGSFLLGALSGFVLMVLIYPVARTFPGTLLLIVAGRLRIAALIKICWALLFPIVLVAGGYYLLDLFTPAWNVATSRSFLTGLFALFLLSFFAFFDVASEVALKADYSEFIRRFARIPEGATFEELKFANAVMDWCLNSGSNETTELKQRYMYQLAEAFDPDEDHENGIVKSFEFLQVNEDVLALGLDIYQWQKKDALSSRADRARDEKEREEEERWQEQWQEWENSRRGDN